MNQLNHFIGIQDHQERNYIFASAYNNLGMTIQVGESWRVGREFLPDATNCSFIVDRYISFRWLSPDGHGLISRFETENKIQLREW